MYLLLGNTQDCREVIFWFQSHIRVLGKTGSVGDESETPQVVGHDEMVQCTICGCCLSCSLKSICGPQLYFLSAPQNMKIKAEALISGLYKCTSGQKVVLCY